MPGIPGISGILAGMGPLTGNSVPARAENREFRPLQCWELGIYCQKSGILPLSVLGIGNSAPVRAINWEFCPFRCWELGMWLQLVPKAGNWGRTGGGNRELRGRELGIPSAIVPGIGNSAPKPRNSVPGVGNSVPNPWNSARSLLEQLHKHQGAVLHPEFRTPFRSVGDALRRLLPYHVYQGMLPAEPECRRGQRECGNAGWDGGNAGMGVPG